MLRKLFADRRGSTVVIAPIFIVMSVLILATVVSSISTTQTVLTRSASQQESGATGRSVVAAMGAELNSKPLASITAEVAAGGAAYRPSTWIPAADETFHVTSVTDVGAGVIHLSVTLGTGQSSRDMVIEYVELPVVWADGEWVPAGISDPHEHLVWLPARTVKE